MLGSQGPGGEATDLMRLLVLKDGVLFVFVYVRSGWDECGRETQTFTLCVLRICEFKLLDLGKISELASE